MRAFAWWVCVSCVTHLDTHVNTKPAHVTTKARAIHTPPPHHTTARAAKAKPPRTKAKREAHPVGIEPTASGLESQWVSQTTTKVKPRPDATCFTRSDTQNHPPEK